MDPYADHACTEKQRLQANACRGVPHQNATKDAAKTQHFASSPTHPGLTQAGQTNSPPSCQRHTPQDPWPPHYLTQGHLGLGLHPAQVISSQCENSLTLIRVRNAIVTCT